MWRLQLAEGKTHPPMPISGMFPSKNLLTASLGVQASVIGIWTSIAGSWALEVFTHLAAIFRSVDTKIGLTKQ